MATQDRLPTGIGSLSGWTSLAGGDKWLDVDDPVGTPDDAATYIFRSGSINTQMFTFPVFAITSSAVSMLTVTYRAARGAVGSLTVAGRIKVNATEYAGTFNAQAETWATFTEDWLTNPDTAGAWTEADIEGAGSNPLIEFGVRNGGTTGSEEARCTQVYATVTYTEAGGGGNRRRRMLLGAA